VITTPSIPKKLAAEEAENVPIKISLVLHQVNITQWIVVTCSIKIASVKNYSVKGSIQVSVPL